MGQFKVADRSDDQNVADHQRLLAEDVLIAERSATLGPRPGILLGKEGSIHLAILTETPEHIP